MNNYNNGLFNALPNGNMQTEIMIHQQFLNSPEGKKAEQDFAEKKKIWWEKLNNPNQVDEPKVDNERIDAMESKIDLIIKSLGVEKE